MNAVIDLERATARIDALMERNSQWPDPRPIVSDLPPAPAFDANALLPKPLAEFVMDEADRMCAAPDYVAATLLVALGSVIGTKCAVKPKRRDDWIVTPTWESSRNCFAPWH